MDHLEHAPELQPEAAPSVQPQTEQPVNQQPAQPEQPGFYHGAGAGRREPTFAYTPYATYYPQQPYQQQYRPWQQEPQPAPQPKKEKKGGRILRGILACVLTVALVAAGCGITAGICNNRWKQQSDLLLQNMQEKVAALQQQIDDKKVNTESGGVLQPGLTLTATEIYQQNVNSVVAITCVVRANSGGQIVEGKSAGTGFIITENGYIVTNHHVIEGATKIMVTLSDGTQHTCTLVGSDSTNDIAVIKAPVTGLKSVKLGKSADIQVGDQVVAIGNALGELSSTLTVGYISGINRDITTDGTIINMIQTDAAINSGNSGGPLFNARGEVIGITTAKYSGTTSSGAIIEGISFAIPLDDVIDMIEDLRDFGYIKSAYLGVMVWEVDADIAATYNLPQGVYVEDVTVGACAAKAGVLPKDIIVELGGYQVRTMNDLSRALRSFEAGETVTIVVWRSGQRVVLSVTLDEKPRT